jgi:hypothetical protein
MGKDKRKGTAPASGGDLLAFDSVTFFPRDGHDRSPSVCDRSGRLPGRAQEEAGVQRPPHWHVEGHASKGSSLLAAWACVCPHMLASSGLCRLGVPFRRRRSGQESTPLFFLFMRHNTSYLGMQVRSLCFILAPEREVVSLNARDGQIGNDGHNM